MHHLLQSFAGLFDTNDRFVKKSSKLELWDRWVDRVVAHIGKNYA